MYSRTNAFTLSGFKSAFKAALNDWNSTGHRVSYIIMTGLMHSQRRRRRNDLHSSETGAAVSAVCVCVCVCVCAIARAPRRASNSLSALANKAFKVIVSCLMCDHSTSSCVLNAVVTSAVHSYTDMYSMKFRHVVFKLSSGGARQILRLISTGGTQSR